MDVPIVIVIVINDWKSMFLSALYLHLSSSMERVLFFLQFNRYGLFLSHCVAVTASISSDTERSIQARHLLCMCLSIVINVSRDTCSSNGSSSLSHSIPVVPSTIVAIWFSYTCHWQLLSKRTPNTRCYCCCCSKSFCLFRDEAPVKTLTNADSYFVQNLLISEYIYICVCTKDLHTYAHNTHIYTSCVHLYDAQSDAFIEKNTVEPKEQIIVFERCVVIFVRKEGDYDVTTRGKHMRWRFNQSEPSRAEPRNKKMKPKYNLSELKYSIEFRILQYFNTTLCHMCIL